MNPTPPHQPSAAPAASQIDAVNIDQVQEDQSRIDALHVDAVHVDSARLDQITIDSGPVDGVAVETAPTDGVNVDPVDVDAAHVDPVDVDGAHVDSINVDAAHVGSLPTDQGESDPAAEQTATPHSRRRRSAWRFAWPLLVVAAVAFPAVAGAYPVGIAAHALVLGLLAMSAQLLVAVAGLPAFGQPAYFGVGAYTAALLIRAGHQQAPLLLIIAAVGGGVAAAITAPMLLRTRGTAFLMATFAVQSLTATAAIRWTTVTGGDEGLHTPAALPWPGGAPLTAPAYLYWYTLAVVALAYVAIVLFLRSRLALTLRGIAGHEPRMTALGHRVTGALTAGYTIAGVLAGLAGGLLVVVNRYVSPADIGFEAAALTLLAAAIGAGTMLGAAGGAALVVAVRDGAGIGTGGLSPLLLGLLFLVVAYVRPLAARGLRPFGTRTGREVG